MIHKIKIAHKILLLVFGLLYLTACGKNDSTEQQSRAAIPFERTDECHLCGMIITSFGGPKAELYEREVQNIRKFCSTRDMFAYLLQPENTHRITDIYVHDMAQAPWGSPDDKYLIDARNAWYVINHKLEGAMGPTLASFKDEKQAIEFKEINGGLIIRFEDITLKMLAELNTGMPENNSQQTLQHEEADHSHHHH